MDLRALEDRLVQAPGVDAAHIIMDPRLSTWRHAFVALPSSTPSGTRKVPRGLLQNLRARAPQEVQLLHAVQGPFPSRLGTDKVDAGKLLGMSLLTESRCSEETAERQRKVLGGHARLRRACAAACQFH